MCEQRVVWISKGILIERMELTVSSIGVDSTKCQRAQLNHQCGRSSWSQPVVQIAPRAMCPPSPSFAIERVAESTEVLRTVHDAANACCERNRVATINQFGSRQSKIDTSKEPQEENKLHGRWVTCVCIHWSISSQTSQLNASNTSSLTIVTIKTRRNDNRIDTAIVIGGNIAVMKIMRLWMR